MFLISEMGTAMRFWLRILLGLIRWCKYISTFDCYLRIIDVYFVISLIKYSIWSLQFLCSPSDINFQEDWQLTQRNKVVNGNEKVSALIGLLLQSSLVIGQNCSNCLQVTEVCCITAFMRCLTFPHTHTRDSNSSYNSNSTSGRQTTAAQADRVRSFVWAFWMQTDVMTSSWSHTYRYGALKMVLFCTLA